MTDSQARLPLLLVLCLTGMAGFYLGYIHFGEWQLSVESAQVLAGVVTYPPENLTYYYQIKLWSLVNQVSALFLSYGCPESQLSLIISGIIGMASLQCLAFIVWALSRNTLLSILAPFTIFLYLTGAYQPSHPVRGFDSTVYPIYFMNTGQTFGAIALPFMLTVFAAFGSGFYGLGCLLLGMAPAVHAPSGAFCLFIFGIVLFVNADQLQGKRKSMLIWFALGIAITLASLLTHIWMTAAVSVPPLERALKKEFLLGFIENIDVHRHPIKLVSWGMAVQLAIMSLPFIWRALPEIQENLPKKMLLQAVTIAALISILFALLSRFPAMLPLEVLEAMPGRLQNLTLFAFPALLIGLLGADCRRIPHLILLVTLLSAMLAAYLLKMNADASLLPLTIAAAAIIGANIFRRSAEDGQSKPARLLRYALMVIAASGLLITGSMLKDSAAAWQNTKSRFADWTNTGFMARIKAGQGVLLTGSNIYPVQLFTRRPVLLNGGFLNFVSYSPETAPQMNYILKKIYGVDVFTPGGMIIRSQGLNRNDGKQLWESRSPEEWRLLAREFNFTNIMTYNDWQLNLPVEMHSAPCTLYKVPL